MAKHASFLYPLFLQDFPIKKNPASQGWIHITFLLNKLSIHGYLFDIYTNIDILVLGIKIK